MVPVFDSLSAALSTLFGAGVTVTKESPVFGGDANTASCLTLSNNLQLFMKSNTISRASFFEAEAEGLAAIAYTETIRTPKLYGRGVDKNRGISFLLMEYITPDQKRRDFWELFGQELAAMHQTDTSYILPDDQYGFTQDNYIGAGMQYNTPCASWIEFFRSYRLDPQIRLARHYFDSDMLRRIWSLLDSLDTLLVEPKKPSLLHGDLWSGNFIAGTDGKAWLIDPAVYVGHPEADLAMTELFGGFSASFYRAYQETYPLQPDYDARRDLYNLYHLLNHLNLFGISYLPAVLRIVQAYS